MYHRNKPNNLFDGANRNDDMLDPYDNQISNLKMTVGQLQQVSNEIGDEIERQNKLLDAMHNGFEKSQNMAKRLLQGMNDLIAQTGLSPMTLTFFFCMGVFTFLWIYFKIFG